MVKAAGIKGGHDREPLEPTTPPPSGRSGGALTCNPVFTLTLHLRRLHVDALVPDEAGTGDASVRLTEAFVT